ncbi:hypothetical protein ZOSMA_14G01180 [Zostera marina]|uniref:J domain-containing protein n=1 Tax=Zostera marina TaxID=29655 RepID=A0A0K9PWQ2_ZOSMR|nr:hypothetical protein ZOSMA_14G01180 [Zostera marina]
MGVPLVVFPVAGVIRPTTFPLRRLQPPTTRKLNICCCSSNNESRQGKKSPYEILGVELGCSVLQLKTAFRGKVKQFHPDVMTGQNSDAMIRLVIEAYDELMRQHGHHSIDLSSNFDPFEEPECEATDVFVNEVFCIGKGCPYSCVKTAPDAFSFMDEYGYGSKARATSQGGVRLDKERSSMLVAVKQCPRKCIHYVTPAQKEILEELLHNILTPPLYDSGEMDCLESLITKAKYENGRYMSKFEN